MRIAIVGSGVSGISALWLLNEYSDHEVNIYEKDSRLGGHTNTVEFKRDGKESCMVDTGFIVCNPPTYPNFLRFIDILKVPLLKTEMTFAISRDRGLFEWAGEGLGGIFCQIGNVLNPRLYRMIFDILRFNMFSLDILKEEGTDDMSIGEYLDREGYGDGFKEDYLLPMTAAIWSTPADQAALDFPATTLIRFFHNHHLLQITGKPKWLTVQGGSKKYIEAVTKNVRPENIHLNSGIVGVSSTDEGVVLEEENGARHTYNHVIMATHSDTTLSLLRRGGGVSEQEESVLAPWEWNHNEAFLHWDERLMPVRRRAYSAWNYLTFTSNPSAEPETTNSDVDTISLTYSMNILQHLPESRHGPVLVTLNPPFPPDPKKVVAKFNYEHPMMTNSSVATQSLLPEIQNKRNISYVGAWTKYGFHEDGFSSSYKLLVDGPFGVKAPFPHRPAARVIKKPGLIESVGRGVVGGIERVRRAVESTGIWVVVGWWMVIVLVLTEKVSFGLGNKKAGEEAKRLRGYWDQVKVKLD